MDAQRPAFSEENYVVHRKADSMKLTHSIAVLMLMILRVLFFLFESLIKDGKYSNNFLERSLYMREHLDLIFSSYYITSQGDIYKNRLIVGWPNLSKRLSVAWSVSLHSADSLR